MDGAIDDRDNNMRFLGIIRHNAERLATLTADLLTLSRIELKNQEFRFAAYNVNALLRDIVDSVRPVAARKNISLELQSAPENTEVFCDSQAIYQILSNLLDNAVKYTPEGRRHRCWVSSIRRSEGCAARGSVRARHWRGHSAGRSTAPL